MAQRLNKELREEIFNNAIAGAFYTNKYQARKDLWLVAREVYEYALRPFADQIQALPAKMSQDSCTTMSFRFKGQRGVKTLIFEIEHNFKYGFSNNTWNESDQTQEDFGNLREEMAKDAETKDSWPFSYRYKLNMANVKVTAALTKKLSDSYKNYKQVLNDYDQLAKTLNSTLNAAYSIEKLLEMWPRAAEYLPMMPVTGQAMAINIPALEKLLDASRS